MSGRLSFRPSTLPRQANRGIRHTCAASSWTASSRSESPDVVRLKRRRVAFGHPGIDEAPRLCGSLFFFNRWATETQYTVIVEQGMHLFSYACSLFPVWTSRCIGIAGGPAFGKVAVGWVAGMGRFPACVSEVWRSTERKSVAGIRSDVKSGAVVST